MEKVEDRLLEEWKANLDLLKFYETLKQQRFAHFLTIQTAFLAIFALLAKEAIGVFSLVTMAALALVPIAPLFISFHFIRLDKRGRIGRTARTSFGTRDRHRGGDILDGVVV